jgi:hypothetical protein
MERIKKQKLEKKKNEIGLIGTALEITDDLRGNSFSAHIQNDWRKIRMDYQKDLNLVPDAQTETFCRNTGIKDAELEIGDSILKHECGHRELPARTTFGCPYDVETHDRIKSEVAKALKEKGKDPSAIVGSGQDLSGYVTNCVEDILDNVNCRNHTDFAGQTLFWNNQGLTRSQNGKYNPFYEAFVRTNLFLGKEVKSHTLLSRFFSGDERVLPAVRGFLEDVCRETEEKSSIGLNGKQGFQKLFTRNLEQRRKLWQELAYSFTSKTADLLDVPPQEQMFGAGGNGESGNPFDKEMTDPQVQEKIAMGRYMSKEGPSYHADLQEQLYSLYKATSKAIRVETSSFTSSQSMPIVHFGKRFATEEDRKIRFRGIGFDSEGKLGLKTARHHLDFPASYKTHPTQFPSLKIAVMDRSGSMASAPDGSENVGDTSFIPWGDKSKYHFALKGYFGIDNYLERQGVSPFMDCSVVGLSGEEVISGKPREVAKRLLHNPQGSHTTLNASQLENQLSGSALVVSISDGDVSMPSDTSSLDAKLKDSDYVHIQIGGATDYSTYVQGLGKPVLFVRGDDDLSQAMVGFVSNYYKNKGQKSSVGEHK